MSKQKAHEKDAEYWRREVDDIIDTIEKPGYRAVGIVIRLNCTSADLPFAFEINGELHYRGRVLLPVAKPKQPRMRDVQIDMEGKR